MSNKIFVVFNQTFGCDLTEDIKGVENFDPLKLAPPIIFRITVSKLKESARDDVGKRNSITGLEPESFPSSPIEFKDSSAKKNTYFIYHTNTKNETLIAFLNELQSQQGFVFKWKASDVYIEQTGMIKLLETAQNIYTVAHPEKSDHQHGKERVKILIENLKKAQKNIFKELLDFCKGEGDYEQPLISLGKFSVSFYKPSYKQGSYLPIVFDLLTSPKQYTLPQEEIETMQAVTTWFTAHGFDINQPTAEDKVERDKILLENLIKWLETKQQAEAEQPGVAPTPTPSPGR